MRTIKATPPPRGVAEKKATLVLCAASAWPRPLNVFQRAGEVIDLRTGRE